MPASSDIAVSAVIVAAGEGRRLAAGVRKQYLPIAGRSILAHTVSRIDTCRDVESIYLVVPAADLGYCEQQVLPETVLRCPVTLVAGGEERQNSVYNALEQLTDSSGLVAVHDGVRPLVDPGLVSECIACAAVSGACIPGIPVDDTIKKADSDNCVAGTVDRHGLWLVQTPQVFRTELLQRAHRQARREGCSGTDDAALVERLGHRVKVIPGSRTNIKITTASDLALAKALLGSD